VRQTRKPRRRALWENSNRAATDQQRRKKASFSCQYDFEIGEAPFLCEIGEVQLAVTFTKLTVEFTKPQSSSQFGKVLHYDFEIGEAPFAVAFTKSEIWESVA
jgi:hypothetical protein